MKTKRLTVFILSGMLIAAIATVTLTTYWKHTQVVFRDAPKLIEAMQAFSRDLTRQGKPLPATVSLRELVTRGYIGTSDVRAFDGMEVTLSLTANETYPQSLLMWARLPDGTISALLGDGSVQQLSQQRFEEYLKTSGTATGQQMRACQQARRNEFALLLLQHLSIACNVALL